MKNYLIVDLSNISHVARHTIKGDTEFHPGLIAQKVFINLFFATTNYQVDHVLIACDEPNVWRRDIYPEYKRNRDLERDVYHEETLEVIKDMKAFFNECTAVPAVSVPRAEADDVIAVATEMITDTDPANKVYILSADKDFLQLTSENVKLISTHKGKVVETEDPDYFLFEKCIRGDRKDNVFSAFPRVRSTRLQKAWEEPDEMLNLMEDQNNRGEAIKDAYWFNKKLVDLTLQPSWIRDEIRDAIQDASESDSKYDFIKVTKFLAKYEMENVFDNINQHKKTFKLGFSIT